MFAEAALIVALFHALLFFLFTESKPAPESPAAVKKKVVMISQSIGNISRHKNIFLSMDYGNPELFAKPDSELGFGELKTDKAQPFPVNEPSYGAFPQPESGLEISLFDPDKGNQNAVRLVAAAFFNQPSFFDTLRVKPCPKSYPMWFLNGEPVRSEVLKEALSSADSGKISSAKPSSGTVFSVFPSGFGFDGEFPSAKIIESSGSPELDSLAVRMLLSKTETPEIAAALAKGELSARVEWSEARR